MEELIGSASYYFHDKVLKSDIVILIKDREVLVVKDRYKSYTYSKNKNDEILDFCINLLSRIYFNSNSNMFEKVFKDDLKRVVQEVLTFHNMRTSKKNHRKFVREIKKRLANEL